MLGEVRGKIMLEKMSKEVRGKNYVGQSAWQTAEKALY